ncbi:MotA/TolQ/ExbB proton channel family protein [Paraburkholderia sp. SIMBA_030]|uniref:MotA/TolQ/ExbB proton channel family protein n=1 Tax=Paraburkholderia sp. SIMBA_030 TaxID=3085773 RepID=UPI00397D3E8E
MNMSDFATLLVVDASFFLLAACSLLTWLLILYKGFGYWRLASENRRFTALFWSTAERDPAGTLGSQSHTSAGSKARVAHAGFAALSGAATAQTSATTAQLAAWDRHELLERFLNQQIQRERRALESGLTLLASIANTAPFIGLFGTVFGIIHALHAVAVGSASGIEGIAGPVGQALSATGIGIAVAIPAVLAYNLFVRRVRVTIADLEDYATELVNLAQRNGFHVGLNTAVAATTAMPGAQAEVRS